MPEPELQTIDRRAVTMEIIVVLALGVFTHMAGVVFAWAATSNPPSERNVWTSLNSVVRNLQIVLPLLWIMWRSGRPWRYYGLVRFGWVDVLLSPLLAWGIWLVHWGASAALYYCAYAAPWVGHIVNIVRPDAQVRTAMHTYQQGALAWIAFTMYQMSNGLGEELVLRGYLLPRIREVSGRPVSSAVLVSALAASYHLYQGSHAAVIIFTSQLVMCWVYMKVQRIIPFAIAHGMYDMIVSIQWAMRAAG